VQTINYIPYIPRYLTQFQIYKNTGTIHCTQCVGCGTYQLRSHGEENGPLSHPNFGFVMEILTLL